jgi:predicted RNase H-like nuclease
MNDRIPMRHGKKTGAGENDRVAALLRGGVPAAFVDGELERLRNGRDDFLDACAAAWTARRVRVGQAERFPAEVVRDGQGLDMAMWA